MADPIRLPDDAKVTITTSNAPWYITTGLTFVGLSMLSAAPFIPAPWSYILGTLGGTLLGGLGYTSAGIVQWRPPIGGGK